MRLVNGFYSRRRDPFTNKKWVQVKLWQERRCTIRRVVFAAGNSSLIKDYLLLSHDAEIARTYSEGRLLVRDAEDGR